MKKKAGNLVIGIIFLAGLSLLLYPFVANQWNNYRQKQLISGYEQVVSDKEAAEGIDYDAERKKAEDYNEALLPCVLPDSFALAESSGVDPVYMNTLNIAGDEMMGSVEIPKINIKIPIYHTTEEDVLNKGAGHLEGSSLPVGGANTHAVISAHRGLPSASLFTDLDQMKVGDHFLLHVLDETLCYEVDKISVVKPEDTTALAVEDGQDLVTLLTCTPYGVNTERLLVRGHRVPYVEEEVKEEKTVLSGSSLHTNYLLHDNRAVLATDHQLFRLRVALHGSNLIGRIGFDIGHTEVRRLIHTHIVCHPAFPALALEAVVVGQARDGAEVLEVFRGGMNGFYLFHCRRPPLKVQPARRQAESASRRSRRDRRCYRTENSIARGPRRHDRRRARCRAS